jgi:hypothetical protein
MAQPTLLEIVQDIASSLSSDSVNSISDTPESLQIANIVKRTYYDITARAEFPEHYQLFQLTASGSTLQPTVMTCPTGLTRIDWIKYYNLDGGAFQQSQYGAYSHGLNIDLQNNANNNITGQAVVSAQTNSGSNVLFFSSVPSWVTVGQTVTDQNVPAAIPTNTLVTAFTSTTVTLSNNAASNIVANSTINFTPIPTVLFYEDIEILAIKDFLDYTNDFNPQDGDVFGYAFQPNPSIGPMNLRYRNDKKPECCCVIQNNWVLFDSFDSSLESTLQTSKTMCYGLYVPSFQMVDAWVPPLDDMQFPLLRIEAQSKALAELEKRSDPKVELEARKQWSNLQKVKSFVNRPTFFNELPCFGRPIGSGGYATQKYYR